MRTLHITHNDLDGVGCGILVKRFLPGPVDTVYLGYDEIENCISENMPRYERVIITDVSPSFGAAEMLAGEKDATIIDHHASSAALKAFPFTVHDISKCATLLTYEWLVSQGYPAEPYKNFALCVDDVDMWRLKRKDSLEMAVLFNLLGIERFEKRFREEPYEEFAPSEKLFIELEEERKNSYIKKAVRNAVAFKDKRGFTGCALFAESYASELGNSIICEGTADYVLMINAQQKKASLRSRPEVDVRLLAEANGGGGHKNAAGFSLREEDFDLTQILKRTGITE